MFKQKILMTKNFRTPLGFKYKTIIFILHFFRHEICNKAAMVLRFSCLTLHTFGFH